MMHFHSPGDIISSWGTVKEKISSFNDYSHVHQLQSNFYFTARLSSRKCLLEVKVNLHPSNEMGEQEETYNMKDP